MSKHLERDLESLEREILAQASIVEEMIQKAGRALREIRPELVSEVLSRERMVDGREVQIEEDCLKILALHQPVAIDLRRTATILKINNDLERIADLAVNIAERALSLSEHGGLVVPPTFDRMVEVTVAMVRSALDALVNMDAETAQQVCLRDDEVDSLNRDVIEEMREVMRLQPELVEAALYLFSASRYVERIADHATNIAEDVIYLVDGEITRHKHDLDQIAQLN
ncbi:MAG: phosphate signaling complex protein PhoU [Pirellulales bacterium]|nr:phosphate signaling complex protein PhoU [Pirellulales bacterium]